MKRQNADTVLDLGTFRCIQPHCETCKAEIRSVNGREINDPQAEIQIIAHLKVRDFTVSEWRDKGKNARRHNIRVIVDLENARLIHAGKSLELSNLGEILAGIREALGGAQREQEPLRPEKDSPSLLGGIEF